MPLVASRGRRFKSCPPATSKDAGQGPFAGSSGRASFSMSAECQQTLPLPRADRSPSAGLAVRIYGAVSHRERHPVSRLVRPCKAPLVRGCPLRPGAVTCVGNDVPRSCDGHGPVEGPRSHGQAGPGTHQGVRPRGQRRAAVGEGWPLATSRDRRSPVAERPQRGCVRPALLSVRPRGRDSKSVTGLRPHGQRRVGVVGSFAGGRRP